MVGCSPARVAARGLLSPRVQRPTHTESPRLAQQEGTFQVALRGHCRDAPRGCCRPETHRCRDRFPEYSAYLGPDSTVEPSLIMPGIINSCIFSEQTSLVHRAVPLQNQFASSMEILDD